MKIHSLFAVPLGEYQMPPEQAEPLCAALKQLFINKVAQGTARSNETSRDTQKGQLFESCFDLYEWPETEVQQMATYVKTCLKDFLAQITELSPEQLDTCEYRFHAWFHITRRGGRQGIHNHSNASWSGIYCIDPGQPAADYPDSGVVYFHDPRSNANIYEDSGQKYLSPPFAHGALRVEHRAGRLVFFPSYLLHEIFPYFGAGERIIAPFNCRITLPGDYAANTTGQVKPQTCIRGQTFKVHQRP